MIVHTVEKQKLLVEPFSDDALKLARAIYNTYIKDDKNLYMEMNISVIIKLLKLRETQDGVNYVIRLLEELNEPILVKNFNFYNKIYKMKFLKFCEYSFKNNILSIELSPEYLLAESEYMTERFLG